MSNHEDKDWSKSLHIFLALQRTKDGEKTRCIRSIIKNFDEDLLILEARLKIIGGIWRIHMTVNSRCPKKAMLFLMHTLIDHPEKCSHIDSLWRTSLLQPHCNFEKKNFLLDMDTKDDSKLEELERLIIKSKGILLKKIETPGGWHFITEPFDTRRVCEIKEVSLLRDGYYFVKEVKP